MDFVKLSEIFYQVLALVFSRSWPEVRAQQLGEAPLFYPGYHASLTMFATVVSVSASASLPLTTPFAALYLVVKHAIDSFHLMTGQFVFTDMEDKAFYTSVISSLLMSCVALQCHSLIYVMIGSVTNEGFPPEAVPWVSLATISSLVFTVVQIQTGHRWPVDMFASDGSPFFSGRAELAKDIIEPQYPSGQVVYFAPPNLRRLRLQHSIKQANHPKRVNEQRQKLVDRRA